MTTTRLLSEAKKWAEPHELATGAVVNPFPDDEAKELALLQRKIDAGADFIQTQMIFDVPAFAGFLERARPVIGSARLYASVGLLRGQRMADRVNELPGIRLPDPAYRQISAGGGIELARELAVELAGLDGVDALHVIPLGAETAVTDVAAAFRTANGLPVRRR